MKRLDFSIEEIDDLLEHLYRRLKGKSEGLSLVEPAVVLLQSLKTVSEKGYSLNLRRYSPILIDAILSRTDRTFGFDGLHALLETAREIAVLSGDLPSTELSENLIEAEKRVEAVMNCLEGKKWSHGVNDPERNGRGSLRRRLSSRRSSSSTLLPLVSIYHSGDKPFTVGRTVELRVELSITGEWSMLRSTKPVITMDRIAAEPGGDFERQVFLAVRLAEKIAVSKMKIRDISRIPREYNISIPETGSLPGSTMGLLTGGSAGLAMAKAMISAIGGLGLSRKRFISTPASSMTGMLGEEGDVLPIDDSQIAEKVRACFMSTCDSMELPEENMTSAESALEKLQEEYPARDFKLVPVRDLNSRLDSQAEGERPRTAFREVLYRRLYFWRKHLVAAASLAALLILIFTVLPSYFDREVTSLEHIGSELHFRNKTGGLVNVVDIDLVPRSIHVKYERRIFIDDYDRDGKNEICYVFMDASRNTLSSVTKKLVHLFFFDNHGELEDMLVICPADSIADPRLDLTEATTWTLHIMSRDYFSDNGFGSLMLLCYPPTVHNAAVLIKYSFEEKRVRLFFHHGFIYDIALEDFDNDHRPDLVCSAFNDLLDAYCVAILDPEHIEGASPAGARYEDPRYIVDIAKYYFKIPPFFRHKNNNDRRGEGPTYQLLLKHASGIPYFIHKSAHYRVRYYFEDPLVCYKVEIYQRFKVKPKIRLADYETMEAEAEQLRSGIEYWDGSKWKQEPTVNQSYLDHISKQDESDKALRKR